MSVAEIHARIAAVRAQFTEPVAPPARPAPAERSVASRATTPSFDAVLSTVLGAPTTIGGLRETVAATVGAEATGGGSTGPLGPSSGVVSPLLTSNLLGGGLAGSAVPEWGVPGPDALGSRSVAPQPAVGASELVPLPPGDGWAAHLPDPARPYVGAIRQAADAAGIDPRIVAAVMWAESGFRPDAVSGAGAVGLMQLMPGTARGLGVDPHDPLQNIDGGARYLAAQLERFGRLDHALAAYNAGPGAVQRHGGIPPYEETRTYVARVTSFVQQLTQEIR